MTLDDLADALLELRRYVRSDPEHVRSEIQRLLPDVRRVNEQAERLRGLRLAENLVVGLGCYIFNEAGEFIASTNLEILRGYLYGAAHEIREHAEKRRKEGGGNE